MGDDLDLALALLGDLDGLAEVADAALNLDLLVQELLKGRDIEDLVARGLRGVDDELLGDLGALLGAGLLLFSIDLAYCFTPSSNSDAPRRTGPTAKLASGVGTYCDGSHCFCRDRRRLTVDV